MLSKSSALTPWALTGLLGARICASYPQLSPNNGSHVSNTTSSSSSIVSSTLTSSSSTTQSPTNALEVLSQALTAFNITSTSASASAVVTPPANSTSSIPASSSASATPSANSTSGSATTSPSGTAPWMAYACTQSGLTDATVDPTERWDSVDTDGAWNASVAYAQNKISSSSTGGLTWPELISNYVHGPDEMQCGTIDARNGCGGSSKCTNFPACSFLITNSLAAVSDLLYNQWDAISVAETSVTPTIGAFASTFAPQEDDLDFFFKILADVLGLTFALYVAPLWNIAFKQLPYFATKEGGNVLGTIKDLVNPSVSNSVTLVKDTSLSGAALNAQNTLSNNFGSMCNIWRDSLATYNTQLFNGSSGSINQIWDIISDGKAIQGTFGVDEQTASNTLAQGMIAALMPQAWAQSTQDIHPFILDSGAACGTVNPISSDMLAPETGDASFTCVNGKIYYLLSVDGEQQGCVSPGGSTPYCTPNLFSMPPGSDKLDGNAWGGITIANVINGALNTYSANNNQNGAAPPDPTNYDTISSLIDNGIEAAGVFNIPVCSAQVAYGNWDFASSNKGKPNYPCNS